MVNFIGGLARYQRIHPILSDNQKEDFGKKKVIKANERARIAIIFSSNLKNPYLFWTGALSQLIFLNLVLV
jgi:hypothetical protein